MAERYAKGYGTQKESDEGDISSGAAAAGQQAPMSQSGRNAVGLATGEVAGDAPAPIGVGGGESGMEADAEEVGTEGAESGEEFLEATPAQIAAAESGEESAVEDLRGIEGFEEQESGEEGALPVQLPLPDAGSAVTGGGGTQQEFLPILGALVPALVSSIGPTIAKGVVSRLSPRAKRVITRVQKAAPAVIKTATGAVRTAAPPTATNLIAAIAKLIQTAQQAPPPAGKAGESGMEVSEALVDQAVAAMEVIIKTDDRVRITATTQIPWRRICALRITFPSGATYRGTGFLIGPRAVATAGHCVYLHNQGGWARQVEVIPGCNGTVRPFGQAMSTSFRSVVGWVTHRKPESDYGCVVLPSGAFSGRSLGSFGFAAFTAPVLVAQPVVLAGYPGDKPFAELWGMSRHIKTVTEKTLIYDIDTVGGQSGAPVYIKRTGERYVVGVHNYGAVTGNSASTMSTASTDGIPR